MQGILQSNDLKIHIETGNIYYQDTDTNKSIFEFMKNQQNISKGVIHTKLKFLMEVIKVISIEF